VDCATSEPAPSATSKQSSTSREAIARYWTTGEENQFIQLPFIRDLPRSRRFFAFFAAFPELVHLAGSLKPPILDEHGNLEALLRRTENLETLFGRVSI
jgi:hypothetical protein